MNETIARSLKDPFYKIRWFMINDLDHYVVKAESPYLLSFILQICYFSLLSNKHESNYA